MKQYLPRIAAALLTLPALLLSGCISAGIFAAKTTADTIKGSNNDTVVILPKQENIAAINKIRIDLSSLQLKPAKAQKEHRLLHNKLVNRLDKAGLYKPGHTDGDKLTIFVRHIHNSVGDKSLEAFVKVYDNRGQAVFSLVYIEQGKGLRRISYVREQFIQNLVNRLQKPVQSQSDSAAQEK